MKNKWKDIKGFEGKYQLSNNGEIRSIDRIVIKAEGAEHKQKGKLLKPTLISKKHKMYRLYDNNIITKFKVDIMKNVLKGKEWTNYLVENEMTKKSQIDLYFCTHNFVPIYKIGDYYFSFTITRGYKNLTSLKRLL